MKLNQKLIEQLRNGEIAVENSGTAKQLRKVLKDAFPNSVIPTGNAKYYLRSAINTNAWTAYSFRDEGKPTFKISDFYRPELFTGWAKDDEHPKWMIYFENDIPKFGFNVHGHWRGEHNLGRYSCFEANRPATHEEIGKALIKEAKRRGYKGGNSIKGIHGTKHTRYEIISFTYDAENNRLLTDQACVVFENGKWAEIVEKHSQVKENDKWAEIIEQPLQPKPKTNPIHYIVDGTEYSLDYQGLKAAYENAVNLTDEEFMQSLPQIAHLACIVAYFKGLGTQATISDKGIIHELVHLMTETNEPTNDLQEIREKFNKLIGLV